MAIGFCGCMSHGGRRFGGADVRRLGNVYELGTILVRVLLSSFGRRRRRRLGSSLQSVCGHSVQELWKWLPEHGRGKLMASEQLEMLEAFSPSAAN